MKAPWRLARNREALSLWAQAGWWSGYVTVEPQVEAATRALSVGDRPLTRAARIVRANWPPRGFAALTRGPTKGDQSVVEAISKVSHLCIKHSSGGPLART